MQHVTARPPRRDHAPEVPLNWFGATLWRYLPIYAELIVIALCLRMLGLVEPFVFQVVIDRVLPFHREATLVVVAVLFAAASLFQVGFSVLSGYLGLVVSNRLTQELGVRLYAHLLRLPLGHFRRWNVGETLARMSETDTIRAFIVGGTTGTIIDLVFVVITLGVLFAISPTLTLIVILTLPIQAMVFLGFGPFLRRRLRAQFDAGAWHQSRIVESLTGITTIKSLGAEGRIEERLGESLAATLSAALRVGILNVLNGQAIFSVERLLTVAILFVGAGLVFESELTLGQLVAFHLLAARVTGPIGNFAGLWEGWQNVRIARQRLADILMREPEGIEGRPLLPARIEPSLSLERVSFAYPDGPLVLDSVNALIPACALTLIVGPSGIGKSTLARVICGLEVPTSGDVFLGGHNIAMHDLVDVRRRIAYVPQEPLLFAGTIRDNLVLDDPAIDDAAIASALAAVGVDEMVARMPFGLDTQVGERGTALSGGQRQRLAIARAIVREPAILVLDEPTSALDQETQAKLSTRLTALTATTTIVVITHRPDVFSDPTAVIDFETL